MSKNGSNGANGSDKVIDFKASANRQRAAKRARQGAKTGGSADSNSLRKRYPSLVAAVQLIIIVILMMYLMSLCRGPL